MISPPAMRGTTEYEPSFWMFAITWSLVSCSVAFSPSSTCPAPREARMLASTGLQMSQPRPVPKRSMMPLKVRSPETRTASKSCARENEKCSQRAVLSSAPERASSVPTSFLTSGRHEPHAAPARVQALTPATSVQPSSVTAQRIVPAVTLLHEQTSASSGRSPPAGSSMSPGSR